MQTAGNGSPTGEHLFAADQQAELIVPGSPQIETHSPLGMAPAARSESVQTLQAVLAAFRRRWFLALGLGLLIGCAAGGAVWFVTPAHYTAFSELLVKEVAPKILFNTADRDAAFKTYKQTQMRMVTSPFVLSSALRKPEVANLAMFAETSDPVNWLEKQTEVSSPSGAREFVRVSLSGDEPHELAEVVNAIIEAYMEEVVDAEKLKRQKRKSNLEEVHRGIDEQLRSRRTAMRKLAEALHTSDSAALTVKQQMAAEYFAQLRKEHAQTRFDRMRAESQLISAQAGEGSSEEIPIPELIIQARIDQHDEVQRMTQRMVALEDLISKTRRAVKGDDHPTLIRSQKELDTLHEQMTKLRERLRPRIISQIRSVVSSDSATQLMEVKKRVEVLKAQEQQLKEELESQQIQTKKLGVSSFELESLKKEIEQIEVMDKTVTSEIQRLEIELQSPPRILLHRSADVPKAPAMGRKRKLSGIAGMGMFALICGGIVWLDFRTKRINSAEDVISNLQVPIIGYLPELPRSFKHYGSQSTNPKHAAIKSAWTESVDSTRTMLIRDADQRSINVIMVTSAIPGEGKSTLSSQLASSLARSGRTTLLVDADIRSPSLHSMLGFPLTPGFSELLRGEVDDHDVIQRTQQDGLFAVSAGQISEDALRALSQKKAKSILSRFKRDFDYVVVDTSPVLPVVDTLLIGQQVDAALIAVRRDLSRSARTTAACRRLTSLGIPVLGTVMIGVNESSTGYGGYYGYGYGYGYGSVPDRQEADHVQT